MMNIWYGNQSKFFVMDKTGIKAIMHNLGRETSWRRGCFLGWFLSSTTGTSRLSSIGSASSISKSVSSWFWPTSDDEGNGGTSYLRYSGDLVGKGSSSGLGLSGSRGYCGGGPRGRGGIREPIELLLGPRLGLGISMRGTASMLTLGEAGWLSDDGGGFGGRCSLNDQESVGEGEKSSKVSVGHGNVVVVSSRGGGLVVKDWRVRWPPLRGRRPRDTRSFCNGTVTLMFGNVILWFTHIAT